MASYFRGCCLVLGLLAAVGAGAYPDSPPPTLGHAAVLGGPVFAPDPDSPLPDPVAIQRIFLPADRLDALKAELARGSLKKLDKTEFEKLVRAAAGVQHGAANPARIVEANYKATVQAGGIGGSADWQLGHRTAGPTAMAVDPLPGAILAPKWADGKVPLLFRSGPEGKPQAATQLWVEGPTQNRFSFQWSARTVELPDEDRCVLQFPASPIAALELTVAAERTPVIAQTGVLLTGPFPAPQSDRRLWKIAFGGQTRLELAFRKVLPAEESKPAVGYSRSATWSLHRGEAIGQFEFSLQGLRSGSRPPVFLVDPGLEVLNVSGASVERWTWNPDGAQARPLTIQFRDETSARQATITARAVLPATPANWIPFQIRLPNAVARADAISVQLGADWKLEGWQLGDYRLGQTAATPYRSTRLDFIPALVTGDAKVERLPPSIRIKPLDTVFNTVETLEWRLEPNRTKLSAAFDVTAVRGPIPSFAFRAPAGYVLESAALAPDDPGVTFGSQPGAPNTWFVEPSRALATGRTLEIRLDFRAVESPTAAHLAQAETSEPTPIPKVIPLGAGDRRGVVTVRPLAGMKVSSVGLSASPVPLVGEPGFSVAYRGREADHEVSVTRATPSISADLALSLAGSPTDWRITTILRSRVEGVPVQSLLAWVPGTDPGWKVEPAASATRLLGDVLMPWMPNLAIADRWSALAWAGIPPSPVGSIWRISFSKPVLGDFTCAIETKAAGEKGLSIPQFIGVPIGESGVALDALAAGRFRAAVARVGTDAPTRIVLVPREDAAIRVATSGSRWVFRDVRLQSRVDSETIRETLTGAVVEAGGSRLPITGGDRQFESASIDGKYLALDAGEARELGLPGLRSGSEFRVTFTRRVRPHSGLYFEVDPPSIELPGDPPLERAWFLDPDTRLWPTLESGSTPDHGGSLILLATDAVRAGSLAAAVMLAFGCFAVRRLGRLRVLLAVMVAGAIGIGSWLAPPGWTGAARPALSVAFGCVALGLRFQTRSAGNGLAALALAGVGWSGAGYAQAPEVAKVFVTPSAKGEPGGFQVLAPVSLLEKLESLRRAPLPDLVILSADYDCLAAGDAVTVRAKYSIQSQKAGEQKLSLPLSEVRLLKAALDGREAFPDASLPDRFLIPIGGAGPHELIVDFTVPVQSAGIDRDAKFGVPDLPVSRVGFAAGRRARQPDVLSRSGGQSVRFGIDGFRLEAEHGAGRTVRLHWRDSATAEGAKPTVAVKEGAVWDLGEAGSTLTAAWQYRVEGGAMGSLKIDWPEHVTPGGINLESAEGSPGLPGIRSWKLGPASNGFSVLDIRLQTPVEGRFTLIVRGDSTRLPNAKPVLAFPRAADVSEVDRDSFHAVRLNGLKSESLAVSGAIDYPADAAAREFPQVPEFQFAKSPPGRVVRRAAGKATEFRPSLLSNPPFLPLAVEVIYTIGRRVGVEGAMLAARESGAVEFDLPVGLMLQDVWAPNLAGWSRSGSRVQVWFTQPSADVIVRWAGQLPTALDGETVVELPAPRWPSSVAKLAEPIVYRVRPAPGWMIQFLPVDGLSAKPSSLPDEWVVSAEADPTPAVKFVARPIPKPASSGRPSKVPALSSVPPTEAPAATTAPESPATADSEPWRDALRLAGMLATVVLVMFGGRRVRPEQFTSVGVAAIAALGTESAISLPFWLLAAIGAVWRLGRIARWAGLKVVG